MKEARVWCEDVLSQVVLDGVSSSSLTPLTSLTSTSDEISSEHDSYCSPAIEAFLPTKSANSLPTLSYRIQEQLLVATERFVDQTVTKGMDGMNTTITHHSSANFSLLSIYTHCIDLCSKGSIQQAITSFVDTSHSISSDELLVLFAMIEE